jgi:hypothetical protein
MDCFASLAMTTVTSRRRVGKRRVSAVPTIYHRSRCLMVGTLALCPPYEISLRRLIPGILELHRNEVGRARSVAGRNSVQRVVQSRRGVGRVSAAPTIYGFVA